MRTEVYKAKHNTNPTQGLVNMWLYAHKKNPKLTVRQFRDSILKRRTK